MTRYVIDLKDLGVDRVTFSGSFQPGEVDWNSDDIRQVDRLGWSGFAERAGMEIRFVGQLQTQLGLTCSRCLEPVSFSLARDFDLFFRQRDTFLYDEDEEIELDEKETNTAFFTGTELSIPDILREQILLALPMKALCRPECKGLCPTCGTNLNLQTCTCPREEFHPAFEALSELKRQMDKRSS